MRAGSPHDNIHNKKSEDRKSGYNYLTTDKAITIIGGADGPTSVFIAGKPSQAASAVMIVIGMIIILGTAIIVVRNLKNRK